MSFHHYSTTALVLGAFAMSAACGNSEGPPLVTIDSTTVASATVAPLIDQERTYEYDFSEVRIDSVLIALWEDDLPVSQAWYPIQYLCEDLRGPRLTVELDAAEDAAMARHDFSLGTGRLQCSELLRRYYVLAED